jgi:hypothetical protein
MRQADDFVGFIQSREASGGNSFSHAASMDQFQSIEVMTKKRGDRFPMGTGVFGALNECAGRNGNDCKVITRFCSGATG